MGRWRRQCRRRGPACLPACLRPLPACPPQSQLGMQILRLLRQRGEWGQGALAAHVECAIQAAPRRDPVAPPAGPWWLLPPAECSGPAARALQSGPPAARAPTHWPACQSARLPALVHAVARHVVRHPSPRNRPCAAERLRRPPAQHDFPRVPPAGQRLPGAAPGARQRRPHCPHLRRAPRSGGTDGRGRGGPQPLSRSFRTASVVRAAQPPTPAAAPRRPPLCPDPHPPTRRLPHTLPAAERHRLRVGAGAGRRGRRARRLPGLGGPRRLRVWQRARRAGPVQLHAHLPLRGVLPPGCAPCFPSISLLAWLAGWLAAARQCTTWWGAPVWLGVLIDIDRLACLPGWLSGWLAGWLPLGGPLPPGCACLVSAFLGCGAPACLPACLRSAACLPACLPVAGPPPGGRGPLLPRFARRPGRLLAAGGGAGGVAGVGAHLLGGSLRGDADEAGGDAGGPSSPQKSSGLHAAPANWLAAHGCTPPARPSRTAARAGGSAGERLRPACQRGERASRVPQTSRPTAAAALPPLHRARCC